MKVKVIEKNDPEEPTNDECIEVFDAAHADRMMRTFNELRKQNLFTDVILAVSGKEFQCHRAVLVAGSNYFKAMFCNDHRESKEMLVQINGLQSEVMEILLTFLYTAKTRIDQANVQMLLEAANLFQIDLLRRNCTVFMEKQLDPCNCLGMKAFAESHGLEKLSNDAEQMILQKFMELVEYEEFLTMPKEMIINVIKEDALEVNDELIVYHAVRNWIRHDVKNRAKDIADLMTHVRLPLIHPAAFVTEIETDELLMTSMALVPIMAETRKYHILGIGGDSIRFKNRKISNRLDVLVSIGGSDRVGGYNAPYVEAWNPLTQKWKQFAKLPNFTKTEYAVCHCKNMIVVTGGRIHLKEVWIYQVNMDQWVKGANLNVGRFRHKMISCQGSAFVIGGVKGGGGLHDKMSSLDSVERYDNFNNCWKEMAPLIEPVSNPAVAAFGCKAYVFGGTDDSSNRAQDNKVQIYDSSINQWSFGCRVLSPALPVAASTACGSIWVLGGETSEISKYSPATDEWSQMTVSLPNPIVNCQMTTVGKKIYFAGILSDKADPLLQVWSFCPTKGEIDTCAGQMERYTCLQGCVSITLDNQESVGRAIHPNRKQSLREAAGDSVRSPYAPRRTSHQ